MPADANGTSQGRRTSLCSSFNSERVKVYFLLSYINVIRMKVVVDEVKVAIMTVDKYSQMSCTGNFTYNFNSIFFRKKTISKIPVMHKAEDF